MVGKMTDAEKSKAMQEYRDEQDAAIKRIATLRAARLARDAAAQADVKPKKARKQDPIGSDAPPPATMSTKRRVARA
jgi:hypothetical protein